MLPNLLIALAVMVVCGFLCYVLWKVAQRVDNYQPVPRRVVKRTAAAPQTAEEFKREVDDHVAKECAQCGTVIPPGAKICATCGYAPPINFRTARTGWPAQRRQLENPANPPKLPEKKRPAHTA